MIPDTDTTIPNLYPGKSAIVKCFAVPCPVAIQWSVREVRLYFARYKISIRQFRRVSTHFYLGKVIDHIFNRRQVTVFVSKLSEILSLFVQRRSKVQRDVW